MEPTVNYILGSLFTSGLVAFVFLFRSKRARQEVGYRRLSYSAPLKLFAIAEASLFITGIVFVARNAPITETLECVGIMLPFLLLVFGGMVNLTLLVQTC